jgi:hypothetical protein
MVAEALDDPRVDRAGRRRGLARRRELPLRVRGLRSEEFIGLGMNDAPFAGRAGTLEDARAFREGGGRLVRLTFPETRAQRFGDVVVLYGRYEAVIYSGGAERTLRGRLTEMFVRRNGKWLHPGWHLDLTAGFYLLQGGVILFERA